MNSSVNLMTQGAQLRSAAERVARIWALIIGVMVLALAPLGGWTWQKRCKALRRHEALQASYEPIRQLAGENRTLAVEATTLVERERLPLTLARRRPVVALLGVVSDAIAECGGAVYMEHMALTRVAPPAAGAAAAGRLLVDASATLAFDISRLTKLLARPPITAVKILSSETANDDGTPIKTYSVECLF